jgi:hypothetical protein
MFLIKTKCICSFFDVNIEVIRKMNNKKNVHNFFPISIGNTREELNLDKKTCEIVNHTLEEEKKMISSCYHSRYYHCDRFTGNNNRMYLIDRSS